MSTDVPPPPPPPPASDPGPSGSPPFWRRWTRGWRLAVTVAAGVLVFLTAIGLIFGEEKSEDTQASTVTVTQTVTVPTDPEDTAAPVATVEFSAADAVASSEPAAWAALTASQRLAVAKRWIAVEQPGVAAGALLKTTSNMEGPRPAESMRGFLTRATVRTQARAERAQAARIRAKAARVKAARVKAAKAKAARVQAVRAAAQQKREAAAARARAAEQARAEQEARDAAAAALACDPNYTGACVPPYPPDVNCADIGTSVQVVGSDPHGLDRDGDGWGCESY